MKFSNIGRRESRMPLGLKMSSPNDYICHEVMTFDMTIKRNPPATVPAHVTSFTSKLYINLHIRQVVFLPEHPAMVKL